MSTLDPRPVEGSAIAIIPARGGSKGIPGKNLAGVGGVPLVARAVSAALAAASVARVVVATDDPRIEQVARAAGAEVVIRPAALATDTTTSEAALLHAIQVLTAHVAVPEVLVFMQATSPFVDPRDIDIAVARVAAGERDVVFSAVESHAFLWQDDGDTVVGVNHAHTRRLRRQDRAAEYQETGAFYVMRTAGFVEAGFRFFGRVGVALVDPRTALEIDVPSDLELARAVAPLLAADEPIEVDALVMDFDGVHTDNGALIDEHRNESVRVNRSDGLGIAMLREAGLPMMILSTEQHPVVAARAAKLRVDVEHGLDDKSSALQHWSQQQGLDLARIAYVGNDVNDLACLRLVGWPVVVADAHPAVIAEARVVLHHRGGHGAIRELADRILAARSSDTQEQS